MKIKELFRQYEEAEWIADEADEAWENDYDNIELEQEFNKAYKAEHEAFNRLYKEVKRLTDNAIDAKTFRAMMATKRSEIESLIERIA